MNIIKTHCYTGYDLFQGFDVSEVDETATDEYVNYAKPAFNLMTATALDLQNSTVKLNTSSTIPFIQNTTLKVPMLKCPEEEHPSNIGTFEVPTQRDIMLLIKNTLVTMFNNYHQKALFFLKDIKEVTKATSEVAKKCSMSHKKLYRKCVKHVSLQSEFHTKNLVTSLENQRHDVSAFTEETLCNMSEMKADPVQLIKILAMQEVSLDFSLPGFLRLLNACSAHCSGSHAKNVKASLKRMSDQDLVVRHLLGQKNNFQLIKEAEKQKDKLRKLNYKAKF